ncbi:MAG: M16 family metallopeptidase [Bdellovibrionales bacterium]
MTKGVFGEGAYHPPLSPPRARSLARHLFLFFLLALTPASAKAAVFYPHTYTLANGMQIIIVQNRLSAAVAQMVWIKAGSIDDPKGYSGLAHYLEHMMFKGTSTVPVGAFSALIARMGGDENAYTTLDFTAYHEVVAAPHLGEVMQLEADRMESLSLDPNQAASELSVVKSERQQRTDNSPQGRFAEKMAASLFPDHPYGRPVIGWADEIARITPERARAFYRAHYAPNNAVLVVSGNVEVKDVLRLAAGTFGRLPARPVASRPDLSFTPSHASQRVEMQDARVKQPFVVMRRIVPSRRAALLDSYAYEVLAEALSADEVGLLYRHFVVEQGTATGVDASYDALSLGPSTFSLAATPAVGGNIRALEKDMNAYLYRLARRGLSSQTIQAAKQRLEDSAIFARDRLMAPAEVLGSSVVSGVSVQEVERWPSRIRAVTPRRVNKLFRALIAAQPAVTGILEPAP